MTCEELADAPRTVKITFSPGLLRRVLLSEIME